MRITHSRTLLIMRGTAFYRDRTSVPNSKQAVIRKQHYRCLSCYAQSVPAELLRSPNAFRFTITWQTVEARRRGAPFATCDKPASSLSCTDANQLLLIHTPRRELPDFVRSALRALEAMGFDIPELDSFVSFLFLFLAKQKA